MAGIDDFCEFGNSPAVLAGECGNETELPICARVGVPNAWRDGNRKRGVRRRAFPVEKNGDSSASSRHRSSHSALTWQLVSTSSKPCLVSWELRFSTVFYRSAKRIKAGHNSIRMPNTYLASPVKGAYVACLKKDRLQGGCRQNWPRIEHGRNTDFSGRFENA